MIQIRISSKNLPREDFTREDILQYLSFLGYQNPVALKDDLYEVKQLGIATDAVVVEGKLPEYGQIIRSEREVNGLTQGEFAGILLISEEKLRAVEEGRSHFSYSELELAGNILKLSSDALSEGKRMPLAPVPIETLLLLSQANRYRVPETEETRFFVYDTYTNQVVSDTSGKAYFDKKEEAEAFAKRLEEAYHASLQTDPVYSKQLYKADRIDSEKVTKLSEDVQKKDEVSDKKEECTSVPNFGTENRQQKVKL